MIVEEIPGWRGFLALARDWNALAAADPDGALLDHDWTAQCWKCCRELRDGAQPLVLGVREPERPWQAMLALRYESRQRRLCFLEEHRSQRLDLAGGDDPAHRAELWNTLGRHLLRRRDWDRFDLRLLRPASAEAILAQWPRLGLAVRERGRVRQRRIRLDRPWDAVLASFQPYLRANFRRRHKRLLALGRLEFELQAAPLGLAPKLDECFALEQRGWKGQTATAILDLGDRPRFYRQLAFRLASQGRFRLYCLRLNGAVVAFEYCVAGRRRLYPLKIAYDEAHRTASPGVVLRWLLLQSVRTEFESYEFLGEDADWKRDWTGEVTELVHIRAYNRTLRGRAWRARSLAYAGWRRLRAAARTSPVRPTAK